jgi:hypothetical protein
MLCVRYDPKICLLLFMPTLAVTGRAIALAVIRRLLTLRTQLRSQFSACELYGGQSGIKARVFQEHFDFPPLISFHHRSVFFFNYMLLLPEGQRGVAWEPSEKQLPFVKLESIGQKSTFHFIWPVTVFRFVENCVK